MVYGIIIALITLIALLMAISILLQSGQGEGLAGGMAAQGMPGQLMGARRTADVLSKTTTILGALFMVLCVIANFNIPRQNASTPAVQDGTVNTSVPADPASGN